MKPRNIILPAAAAFYVLCASALYAAQNVCIVKYDSSAEVTTKTGAWCTDATNVSTLNAARTGVKFVCGGPYATVVMYDQATATTQVSVASYQTGVRKSAGVGTPTCDANAPNWTSTGVYFDKSLLADCPVTLAPTDIMMSYYIDNPVQWAVKPKNVPLWKVTFDNVTATQTLDFYDTDFAFAMFDVDNNALDVKHVNADLYCEAPTVFLGKPSGVTVTGGTVSCPGGTSGTVSNITIGFTKPTKCYSDAALTVEASCPSTCTPGVTVLRTSPTAKTVASTKNTVTSVTDTDALPTGGAATYEVIGVCTNGSDAAGSGATDNTPGTGPTGSKTLACGTAPTITASSMKINSVTLDSISASDCGGLTLLEGTSAVITGTIDDSDSDKTQETTKLAYGNADNSVAFPGTAVSASPSSAGAFSLTLPGAAVKAETDLYLAVWATDTVMDVGAAYPSTYAGGITTAKTIPGMCIKKGTKFEFTNLPYPNQMPFRAVGQRLIIGFKMNEQAAVTMRIYSTDGTLIRQVDDSSMSPLTNDNVCNWQEGCSWDGTNYLGGDHWVSNGMYLVNIYAVDTGANFTGQTIDYTKGIVVMK